MNRKYGRWSVLPKKKVTIRDCRLCCKKGLTDGHGPHSLWSEGISGSRAAVSSLFPHMLSCRKGDPRWKIAGDHKQEGMTVYPPKGAGSPSFSGVPFRRSGTIGKVGAKGGGVCPPISMGKVAERVRRATTNERLDLIPPSRVRKKNANFFPVFVLLRFRPFFDPTYGVYVPTVVKRTSPLSFRSLLSSFLLSSPLLFPPQLALHSPPPPSFSHCNQCSLPSDSLAPSPLLPALLAHPSVLTLLPPPER